MCDTMRERERCSLKQPTIMFNVFRHNVNMFVVVVVWVMKTIRHQSFYDTFSSHHPCDFDMQNNF